MSERQPDETSGVSRRRALKIGSAVTTTAITGVVGFHLVGRATASAEASFAAGDVSITTADRQIDHINVEPDGDVTWSALSEIPQSAVFELVVANNSDFEDFDDDDGANASTIIEEQAVDDENQAHSGSQRFELAVYDILDDASYEGGGLLGDATAPFTADDFEAETETTTEETPVYLQLTVGLYEEEGVLSLEDPEPIIEAVDTADFTVSVTHAEGDLTYTIDANTSVESETETDNSE